MDYDDYYDDDYDDYDDYYDEDEEEQYSVSPNSQQYLSTKHQVQHNPKSNDSQASSGVVNNSPKSVPQKDSEVKEACVKSCIEAIQNVLGDSFTDAALYNAAMKFNCDSEGAIQYILENQVESENKIEFFKPSNQQEVKCFVIAHVMQLICLM